MLGYGICLGLAAACAAAIGFALHLDHVGWACDAALMVMRPLPELLRMRGTDRVVAVLVGGRFLLLLVSSPNGAEARFFERKWETVLGVALAVFFGVVVPALLKRAGQASDIKRQWSSTADLGDNATVAHRFGQGGVVAVVPIGVSLGEPGYSSTEASPLPR